MYSLKMEGYEKIYQKIKIEEEKKLNEPLSYYSMNRIIFEDNENKSIKVYDSTLFDGMSTFKIEKVEQIALDDNLIDNEKLKKKEKEKEEFLSYISKMKNILSEIEENTNEIKLEMELDQKKKEEIAKKEKERKEMEEKRKKEEEEKRKKAQEERKRIEEQIRKDRERKIKLEEEQRRIKIEEERRKNEIPGFDDFNGSGRNIKEKLINAGINYENIKKEINKIANDRTFLIKTNKIDKSVNDILKKASSLNLLEENIKNLQKLLKELKETKSQELYLYGCFCLLKLLFKKVKDADKEIMYENSVISSKIIISLKCKTLTYMLFQMLSNICPYIIPLPYKKEHDKLFKEKELDKIYKFCSSAEYLYFTFLYFDKNRYLNIINNYISNIELFSHDDINFFISNSFLCFINVFGNFILRNKKEWINRILKIKENVTKGLEKEGNKIKGKESSLVGINQDIKMQIEDCFTRLRNNQNTKFFELINEINKQNI